MTEKPELDSNEVHNELLDNPKYAVYTHEKQINRIIEILEELSGRVVALEDKFLNLDLDVRFSKSPKLEGPPEPPETYGT